MYSLFLQLTWKSQLAEIFVVFLARAAVVAAGSTVWIRLSQWADRRRIVLDPTSCKSMWADIADGIQILAIDALATVAAFQFGWMRATANSSPVFIAVTFAVFFVWMEIYFYYSHRALHHPKLFWIHRRHHERRATNPWTSLSFSLMERLVLLIGAIAIPAAISQFIPLSIEGFFGYFLFNYIFNVYGHLNVETVPNQIVRSPFGRVFLTTTFHALHHARYRGHYGLFTLFLDRWHGTQFPDYEDAHQKVIERATNGSSFSMKVR